MTTPPSLPTLPGLAWSRHKKPGFSTRVASHVSGREVRVALMSYPLYEFESVYAGLASAPTGAFAGLGASSLQSLMGFFLQLQGQFGTFLYTDPDDNTVAGQGIATGDGSTQSFIMGRALGGFYEPVGWVTNVTNVYLNGVAQAPDTWAVSAPNSIGFNTAPGAGVVIAADFSYAFECRFLDDQMDFEEFMSSLWKLDSMKFRSVKANITPAPPPSWYTIYSVGGTPPTLFADTTTEGGANHYLYNGTTYGSFAALLTALGITFSRSSSAYYTNSSGLLASASSGTPRFDYYWNGSAMMPKGLLVEGASTNLVLQSQFAGEWVAQNVTLSANAATAPDGTTTAASVTDNSTNTHHDIFPALITTTSGTRYTASAFVKPGTLNYVALNLSSSSGDYPGWATAVFNLGNASATSASQTATDGTHGSILTTQQQQLANGWFRISLTATITGVTDATIEISGAAAATGNIFNTFGLPTYAGGGQTFYVWGAQQEALPLASSYIPTTSSTASRLADSLSAAAWAAITAGTLYAKGDTLSPAFLQRILEINDGTANNLAGLSFNASGTGEFDFVDGGMSEAALTAGSITALTPAQLAAAFQANDFALVVNAGTPATASSGSIPSLSKLYIGQGAAGNPLWGHIQQIGVWNNLRAPNAALQGLT